MKEMKIYSIEGQDYEIVDGKARDEIANLYVNNISELKALTNLKVGDVVKTLGYYEVNDGGAGLYSIREKTESDIEDGGSIHFIDSLVAELIIENEVDIRQLGIKQDNDVNVTTKLLKNIFSSGKFTNIVIRDLMLDVNNTISISSNFDLKIINTTITDIREDEDIKLFEINKKENIKITGLNSTLKFNKPDTEQQFIFNIVSSKNIIINGLNLTSPGGDSISFSGSSDNIPCSNIIVENCIIDNCRRNGLSFIGGVNGVLIKNCKIINTSGGSVEYGIDIEIWKDSLHNKNITIEGCVFEGNNGGSIAIHPNTENILIKNNIFNSNKIISSMNQTNHENKKYPKNLKFIDNIFNNSNIYFAGTRYATISINNNTFNNGRIYIESDGEATSIYGEEYTYPGSLLINNNILNDVNNIPIYLERTNNVVVSNNIINNCTNEAITLLNSANIHIHDNIIKNYCGSGTDRAINLDLTKNVIIENNTFESIIPITRIVYLTLNNQNIKVINNNANKGNCAVFISSNNNPDVIASDNITPTLFNTTLSSRPPASQKLCGCIINEKINDEQYNSYICVYDSSTSSYKWKLL